MVQSKDFTATSRMRYVHPLPWPLGLRRSLGWSSASVHSWGKTLVIPLAEAVFGAPIVLPNEFLKGDEILVDTISKHFLWMLLLFPLPKHNLSRQLPSELPADLSELTFSSIFHSKSTLLKKSWKDKKIPFLQFYFSLFPYNKMLESLSFPWEYKSYWCLTTLGTPFKRGGTLF